MTLVDRRPIIAIDPTHRGIAFAYFEEGRLLDWGTRRDSDVETALGRILGRFGADVLVLEDPDAKGCERRSSVREFLREQADEAEHRGLAVVAVARGQVRLAWRARGVTTKQAAAVAIAEALPALESVLPPPRKIYRSEDARIQIFDAASLALHAFGARTPPDALRLSRRSGQREWSR